MQKPSRIIKRRTAIFIRKTLPSFTFSFLLSPANLKMNNNNDQLRQEDVPNNIPSSVDERTPLQTLVDEVRQTARLRDDQHEMELEFLDALLNLVLYRDAESFMDSMQIMLESPGLYPNWKACMPYPGLMKPLDNFMPGYMNLKEYIKPDDGKRVMILEFKNDRPKLNKPVENNDLLRNLMGLVKHFASGFEIEFLTALSNLLSFRIDEDTFMTTMKTRISDTNTIAILQQITLMIHFART